ncbi:hypothetical protein H5410_063171, partial [Solanum commersonii]
MFHLLFLVTLFLHVQSVPQNSSIVEFLPGFDGPLPFYLETGYIGIGKSEEVQLFYYFVKSESDPRKDPLLLWLSGGPGCSSFTGLAYEVGPLDFGQKAYNGSLPILVSSPYSWTKFASILFLEQPANTGFSYATTSEACKCTDLQACDQVYEFLRKWLINHPEFILNPFYVSGDSYSGITIPVIVQLISDGIEAGKEPLINLKGYSLGNPKTFPGETNYQIPYCHGMGLISNELYESLNKICKGDYLNIDPTNKLCVENFKMFKNLVSSINDQQILEPFCGTDSEEHPPQLSSERRSLEEDFIFQKFDDFICRESRVAKRNLSTYWANDPRVQEALHVRKGTIRRPWARCRQSIMSTSYTVTFMNSIPYLVNISSKGYRSLIYSGDHDMVVPFQSTQAWIKYLNYSIIDDWRPWMIDGQVAGYTRSFSNHMTYATVKARILYIGVGKSEEVQLFYYFVKSESDPIQDPLLLWLTGGPGCSSFTGLAYEVGPLEFGHKAYNGSLPILVTNPYSWTKFASILFLEQPVNTGFSYGKTSEAYKCTDLQACDHVYEFLRKWFVNHPEFISNSFYVSGDSYSGITIPVIVQLISDGIKAGKESLINLKGYSLGNPVTFPEEDNYQIPFCHGMGLISDKLYESLNEFCKGDYINIDPTNKQCVENFKMFKNLVSGINGEQILVPFCGTDSDQPRQLSSERRSLEEDFIFQKYDDFICRESRVSPSNVTSKYEYSITSNVAKHNLSTYWANDPRVQEALHVRKGTIRRPWARCRQSIVSTSYTETFMNSIPYHVNISSKGYRSLVYSGDHDMVVPFQSTQAWIKYLNYSIIDDWRPWTIDGQVA